MRCGCHQPYQYDEDNETCFDCRTLHEECSECLFTANQWFCTACQNPDFMVNQLSDGCERVMLNCELSIDDQQDVSGPAIYDSFGYQQCAKCNEGYLWIESTRNVPGVCEECTKVIDNCILCENDNSCQACETGFFLSLDNSECVPPIEYCASEPTDYGSDCIHFVCPECIKGYRSYMGECVPCSVDNCLDCDEADRCIECDTTTEDYFLSPLRDECVLELDNCKVGPDKYQVNDDGDWMCPQCAIGYTHDEYGICVVCSDLIEGCSQCDQYGKCLECADTPT